MIGKDNKINVVPVWSIFAIGAGTQVAAIDAKSAASTIKFGTIFALFTGTHICQA